MHAPLRDRRRLAGVGKPCHRSNMPQTEDSHTRWERVGAGAGGWYEHIYPVAQLHVCNDHLIHNMEFIKY